MKFLTALQIRIFRLVHSCEFGDSILYSFYQFIVRTLECKCCIFYRGIIVGVLLGITFSLLWSLL